MRRAILAGLAFSAAAGCAFAAGTGPDLSQMNPAVMKGLIPDQIPWQVTPGLDTAFLYGNPNQPGFYVLMYRWKPGNSSRPHFHDQDRYLMVLSGTWWVGQGTNFDLEHVTAPVKPGTFVTHYKNQVHYDGARATEREPAVEIVWGMGPVKTVACDSPAGAGPGPCEDARKVQEK
jgi:hypothetical protein